MAGRLEGRSAGIGGAIGPIEGTRGEDGDATVAARVRGAFLGIPHGARAMREAGLRGSIVSAASVAGLSGGDAPVADSACGASDARSGTGEAPVVDGGLSAAGPNIRARRARRLEDGPLAGVVAFDPGSTGLDPIIRKLG